MSPDTCQATDDEAPTAMPAHLPDALVKVY